MKPKSERAKVPGGSGVSLTPTKVHRTTEEKTTVTPTGKRFSKIETMANHARGK